MLEIQDNQLNLKLNTFLDKIYKIVDDLWRKR